MRLGGQRITFYPSIVFKLCVENYFIAASSFVKWHQEVERCLRNGVNLSPHFQSA